MSKIMNTTRPCITRFLVPDKTIVKPHWMRSVKSGYILLKKLVKSVNLESLPKIYVPRISLGPICEVCNENIMYKEFKINCYIVGCANKDGYLGTLGKFIEYCRITALLPVIALGIRNNW